MLQAIKKSHTSAVAAAMMFQFTEQAPMDAKLCLSAQGRTDPAVTADNTGPKR